MVFKGTKLPSKGWHRRLSKSESCPSETIWQCWRGFHCPQIAVLLLSPCWQAATHVPPSMVHPALCRTRSGEESPVLGKGAHLERWLPPLPIMHHMFVRNLVLNLPRRSASGLGFSYTEQLLLQSIESQLSKQGFEKNKIDGNNKMIKEKKKIKKKAFVNNEFDIAKQIDL